MRRSRTSRAASSRLGGIFDYAVKKERLEEVNRELESPNVWDDPKRAQELGRERAQLDTIVTGIDEMTASLDDAKELLDMAAADGDEATVQSIVDDLNKVDAAMAEDSSRSTRIPIRFSSSVNRSRTNRHSSFGAKSPPHPPFGHLLPQGEKEERGKTPAPGLPLPLRERARQGVRGEPQAHC